MTQSQANERDAKRYRIMRAVLCAPEARQREIHALIAPVIGEDDQLDPQRIDRAMDLILNTIKIV